MKISLENRDCLEFLKSLPDESVDLALLDPPYFIGHDSWDKQWSSEQKYLDWCDLWTREAVRVLRHNRPICVWGTLKTDTFLHYKLKVLNKISGPTRRTRSCGPTTGAAGPRRTSLASTSMSGSTVRGTSCSTPMTCASNASRR